MADMHGRLRTDLRGVLTALTTVIIEYQRVVDGDKTSGLLEVPQLAVWARGGVAFCGNEEAAAQLKLFAGRLSIMAEGLSGFLGAPSADALAKLKEAKEELRAGLATLDEYVKAEIAMPAAIAALAAATEAHKEAVDEAKSEEDPAKKTKLEATATQRDEQKVSD